jgi:hypothetical protein
VSNGAGPYMNRGSILRPLQQLRQLGDSSQLSAALHQRGPIGRYPPSWLILEIDVSNSHPIVVFRDEAGVVRLFGRPRRREAAVPFWAFMPQMGASLGPSS